MSDSLKIGRKWEMFLEICQAVKDSEDFFSENDYDFADSMGDKLAQYREDASVTLSQINYLNQLGQKCRDVGLI